jgi:hypothetical protein
MIWPRDQQSGNGKCRSATLTALTAALRMVNNLLIYFGVKIS